jgi:putative transposase
VLLGEITMEIENCIRAFSEQQYGEITELTVQIDHVDLLVLVLLKVSISSFVRIIKGSTAIRVINNLVT